MTAGYVKIPFLPFLLGLSTVVGLPLGIMRVTNQEKWVWRYVFLISLMMAVYYWDGLAAFAKFMGNYTGTRVSDVPYRYA